MAFYDSSIEALLTVIVALTAGLEIWREINEEGDKCHAASSSNNLGMKGLMAETMKPPP